MYKVHLFIQQQKNLQVLVSGYKCGLSCLICCHYVVMFFFYLSTLLSMLVLPSSEASSSMGLCSCLPELASILLLQASFMDD